VVRIGCLELGEFPLLLAPMEDVSDPPFRKVCKQQGADLMFTEFISSEGLIRQATKSCKKLDIFHDERPIGIQIFGSDEEVMRQAALIAEAAGPDLIDINYGCPVRNVTCHGAGAALLQDIPKMVRITRCIVQSVKLPVTVKTRLGWDEKTKNIVEVAERLQDTGIKAITIHGRTRAQMYKGEADWTLIAAVKNNPRMHIPVFGNGDVDSPQKALEYKNRFGVDGIMIGRAAIGNPWIFKQIKQYVKTGTFLADIPLAERVKVCRQHLYHSVQWKGESLAILEMRRHYAHYFRNIPHFKDMRLKLVTETSFEKIIALLDEIADMELTCVN
jgi:nifR3 family TIM-barrel protein